MTAAALVEALNLAPHPEGGYFRETYRSAAGTAIYYLLPQGQISRWHRVGRDELWHFYQGEGLLLSIISPEGEYQEIALGTGAGQVPQGIVLAHHWQAARPLGSYALVGCTVCPPFTWDTFEMSDPTQLARLYPHLSTVL